MVYPVLFVGIDVSKLKHDVAIVNEHKKLVGRPLVITEDRTGYEQLLCTLQRLARQYQTTTFVIGLEATSEYWKNIYHFLVQHTATFLVTVLNPIQTRKYAEANLRRAKTDPIDAQDIACFMVEKRPQPSYVRSPVFEAIKDLDRQIYSFKKQQTMTTNKLRLELAKVAPEIERAVRSFKSQQVLTLLERYPTAAAMAQASHEELKQIRYGQQQWRLPSAFITKMKNLAENSIACKTGPYAGIIVQALAKRLLTEQQTLAAMQAQITELYQSVKEHHSLLTTITGISKETAIVLEAHIGDVQRFPNAKKLVAYFGMNPTVNKSGKLKKRISYLQKKGSGIVRHKLFMISLNLIRHKSKPFYDYYQRLVAAGKPKLVALAATMRKLLVICYTILKTQQPFSLREN
jgi:transposase